MRFGLVLTLTFSVGSLAASFTLMAHLNSPCSVSIKAWAEAGVAARHSRPAMIAASVIADTGWCSAVASTRIMIFSRL